MACIEKLRRLKIAAEILTNFLKKKEHSDLNSKDIKSILA